MASSREGANYTMQGKKQPFCKSNILSTNGKQTQKQDTFMNVRLEGKALMMIDREFFAGTFNKFTKYGSTTDWFLTLEISTF